MQAWGSGGLAIDVEGQQAGVVCFIGEGKLFEDVLDVGVGFKSVGLCGFDQAEEYRTGIGSAGMTGKQPVLAAHHEGADGVFGSIVVRL